MSSSAQAAHVASLRQSSVSTSLRRIGAFILRYSLVFFLFFFGALKWTTAEAQSIQPLAGNSPLLSWLYAISDMQTASEIIGVVELVIGALILLRRWAPRASAVGSIAASGMFLVTLSFLLTTPNVGASAPFLLKDLTLLGAAVWSAGEALDARPRRARA